ncbi:UNVERIFIED_ORG: hypothetical protein ABIC62_003128 [Burkholderia sp. 1595]|uniref:Uncharacterized protein n=1 Tax=Paraburkholderia terricola TaxID=169427 RepID=A0ABU1LQ01_9BURK|nr:hypothetical protein [Paraburkholderia terricola]MDR6482280.1 hypothetical protein [Paraburkholderia terricola]
MVLMRLPAHALGPGGYDAHFAVLARATSPARIPNTPVRQLDFFYFYCVGMQLIREGSRTR